MARLEAIPEHRVRGPKVAHPGLQINARVCQGLDKSELCNRANVLMDMPLSTMVTELLPEGFRFCCLHTLDAPLKISERDGLGQTSKTASSTSRAQDWPRAGKVPGLAQPTPLTGRLSLAPPWTRPRIRPPAPSPRERREVLQGRGQILGGHEPLTHMQRNMLRAACIYSVQYTIYQYHTLPVR